MELTKQQIWQAAQSFGADDVRFTGTDDFDAPFKAPSPHGLLPEAKSIIVLFARYTPAAPAPKGRMGLSAYYIASHRLYIAARKLTDWLIKRGSKALHAKALPAKATALRTGGFLGDNGFYYHPDFGSFVAIQTVLTDAAAPGRTPQTQETCLHCGECAAACPSSAVGSLQNCLRYHLYDTVPEDMRGDVYQLLGCEKCQSACPLNIHASSLPISYPVEELLEGKHLTELKTLAGTNFVRKQRILSQAALYAAGTGAAYLADTLQQLTGTVPQPVKGHAAWALKQLKQKGENA